MPLIRIWDFSECRLQLVSLMASRKWATNNEEIQYFSIDPNTWESLINGVS